MGKKASAHRLLTSRELNRALLARQGLLTPWEKPLSEVVESIGALQAQAWQGLPVALWSRVRGFAVPDLYDALERRELVTGTLLRATLHLVSAREHPVYGRVVADSGVSDWRRTSKEPFPQMDRLRSDLLAYAAVPRTVDETCTFIEEWLARHPGALDEAEHDVQQKHKWRPFRASADFLRAPEDGLWGPRAPAAVLAAPHPPSQAGAPDSEEALAAVLRCHLRAFGPAAAEDAAYWIGWKTPPVRAALDGLPGLLRFQDEAGRTLYDLPEAPRPDPDAAAPVRILPGFDNVMLAYDARRRQRILPDEHREKVYVRANLQVLPVFLIDGLIAGIWSVEEKRREAALTLRPFEKLARAARAELTEEAERLIRFISPGAKEHGVVIAP
jgi:Winged helix DNA-binding domain